MKKNISIAKILNEWFNVYLSNFIKISLPVLVFSTVYYLVLIKIPQVSGGFGPEILHSFSNPGYVILTVYTAYIACVIIDIVSANYTDDKKEYSEYFKVPATSILRMFAITCLTFLGYMLGFVLLIVPGVLLFFGWCLADVIYINEDGVGIKTSIGRSWKLTKGSKWQIFVLIFGISVVILLITVLMFYLIQGSAISFASITDGSYADFVTNPLYSILSTTISTPMYLSLSVVIYFNIKKVKEGFDVDQLSANFMEGEGE